jgi:hypothetical protein
MKPSETAVRGAHQESERLSLLLWDTRKKKSSDERRVYAEFKRAEEAFVSLKTRCVRAFAKDRGWNVKQGMTLDQLVAGKMLKSMVLREPGYSAIDHPEGFLLNRRPIAILSHTYGPWQECTELAQRHNFSIERLSFSWYNPGVTMAVLFTRR